MQNEIYEKKLQEEFENLNKCQKSHTLDSCLQCKQLLDCDLRERYVKAVYENMTKGKIGGFEF